jgi:hypothetical protein
VKIELTKDDDAVFGQRPRGESIVINVPDDLGVQDGRIRAFEMLQRDNITENRMEWTAEVVE